MKGKESYFPHKQPYSFEDDQKRFEKSFPIQAFAFNESEKNPVYFLYYDAEFSPQGEDTTLEVLMQGLHPKATEVFSQANEETVRSSDLFARLEKFVSPYQIDEFFFDPAGYSLNGIQGAEYITMHITPQKVGSYVSVETNRPLQGGQLKEFLEGLANVFQPTSYDVILFANSDIEYKISPEAYQIETEFKKKLKCGYDLRCTHLTAFGESKNG